jgi:hypothetical protein
MTPEKPDRCQIVSGKNEMHARIETDPTDVLQGLDPMPGPTLQPGHLHPSFSSYRQSPVWVIDSHNEASATEGSSSFQSVMLGADEGVR